MAKLSRTIDAPAKIGGSGSARAVGHLERMMDIGRESVRVARATASLAMTGHHRWQIPASASSLKDFQLAETEIAGAARSRIDRFQSHLARALGSTGWSKTTNGASDELSGGRAGREADAWYRTTPGLDEGRRALRQIQELSSAMNAVSQAERSLEFGADAWRDSGADWRAMGSGMKRLGRFADRVHQGMEMADRTMGGAHTQSTGLSRERLAAFAGAGLLGNGRTVSSIRGMVPPQNVSGPAFAELSRNFRGQDSSDAHAAITINSSPTVVINGPAASGNAQSDVISALRAHREELFDQLKRESARRERAEF
jgi:hypothetical protein